MLIAADSNARSKIYYDIITNKPGKALEEFLTISNLNIVNHRTEPTFETTSCSSYVVLKMVNNQLLRSVSDWTCGIQESCSDYKLLSLNHAMDRQDKPINNTEYMGLSYIIKK